MSKFGRADRIIIPTAAEKAYAAGFFDGEGNICIGAKLRSRELIEKKGDLKAQGWLFP